MTTSSITDAYPLIKLHHWKWYMYFTRYAASLKRHHELWLICSRATVFHWPGASFVYIQGPDLLITWYLSWWRHQMETFSALLSLCAGNSLVTIEFPAQRSVTRSFDVFYDLRLDKRFRKQSWGWWFETPSRLLWRHCNVIAHNTTLQNTSFRAFSGCKWFKKHFYD